MSGFKFINENGIDNLVKKADCLNPGIDYLRVTLKENIGFLDKVYDTLNTTNSNFFTDDSMEIPITYQKMRFSTGDVIQGIISFRGVALPILLYNIFDSDRQEIFKSYASLNFYGAFWRLCEVGYIDFDKYISTLFGKDRKILDNSDITRLDYKIDFFYSKKTKFPSIPKLINIRKNSQIREYKVGTDTNSWSYGSRSAKRVFTRCYDKLLDSRIKGKFLLYEDYFEYEDVFRLEFELLNKFCKGYKFHEYRELVEKFFDSCSNNIFDKVFYEYDKGYKLDKYSELEKIRYFKDFGGRGYSIQQAGYNPFIVLYRAIMNKTDAKVSDKKMIEYAYELYEHMINTEKSIQRKEKAIKLDNLNSFSL